MFVSENGDVVNGDAPNGDAPNGDAHDDKPKKQDIIIITGKKENCENAKADLLVRYSKCIQISYVFVVFSEASDQM